MEGPIKSIKKGGKDQKINKNNSKCFISGKAKAMFRKLEVKIGLSQREIGTK
jgi:hypothetical protein